MSLFKDIEQYGKSVYEEERENGLSEQDALDEAIYAVVYLYGESNNLDYFDIFEALEPVCKG